jgi:hypothetical protein
MDYPAAAGPPGMQPAAQSQQPGFLSSILNGLNPGATMQAPNTFTGGPQQPSAGGFINQPGAGPVNPAPSSGGLVNQPGPGYAGGGGGAQAAPLDPRMGSSVTLDPTSPGAFPARPPSPYGTGIYPGMASMATPPEAGFPEPTPQGQPSATPRPGRAKGALAKGGIGSDAVAGGTAGAKPAGRAAATDPNNRFGTVQYYPSNSVRNAPIYTALNLFGGGGQPAAPAARPAANSQMISPTTGQPMPMSSADVAYGLPDARGAPYPYAIGGPDYRSIGDTPDVLAATRRQAAARLAAASLKQRYG